jgi:6-pyruvoyltetrahydropterin/6-carboxytetrahydropterin synthase
MDKPSGIFKLRVDQPHMLFACARILVYKDNCARMHGHNFQVAVELEGTVNPDCLVVDLSELEPLLRDMCKALNNYLLVPAQNPLLHIEQAGSDVTIQFKERKYTLPRQDVLLLDLPNCSVEMLAYYLCNQLESKLAEMGYTNLTAIAVQVAETPGQSGLYRKALNPAR